MSPLPRRRLAALALLIGGLALSPASTLAAAIPSSVSIVDVPRPQSKWGYTPTVVRVQAGTWVTWSNAGQDEHTVTADDGSFDSGNLDPGDGFSWYFDQPGTYTYTCGLHPWMQGKVIVGNGGPAAQPASGGAATTPTAVPAPDDGTTDTPAPDASDDESS